MRTSNFRIGSFTSLGLTFICFVPQLAAHSVNMSHQESSHRNSPAGDATTSADEQLEKTTKQVNHSANNGVAFDVRGQEVSVRGELPEGYSIGSLPSTHFSKTIVERLTIVEHDENSFDDDLIYLAAIPINIYYESSNEQYVSALIFDQPSTNEEYLVQDIAQRWGSDTQIVTIGSVKGQVITDYESVATPSEIITITSPEGSPESYAAEIATHFWQSADTAVLVPWIDGAIEYVEYVQAASNAAIVASLLNSPLLYVETSVHQTTIDALNNLGTQNVVLIRPPDYSSYSVVNQLAAMGISVTEQLSDQANIIQYIRSLRNTNYLTLIYNNEEYRSKPWTSSYVTYDPEMLPESMSGTTDITERLSVTGSAVHALPETTPQVLVGDGYWSAEDPAGPVGDEAEMPFGPAAYIGAYHAGPVIAFPTPNGHCQDADDFAEYIGDWLYDVFKSNWIKINRGTGDWVSDTPGFYEMERISNSFYLWLNDINADQLSLRENIIIVGDIAEIDPSLDRSILGKAVAGRIGSGEAPHTACIVNRNLLHEELSIINSKNVSMSFVSYAHDLGFTDNDGFEHDVFESEDVPLAYDQAGYMVNYDTMLEGITDTLNEGTRFWVHAGHAWYGHTRFHKPITGPGKFNHFLPINAWRAYEQGGNTSDPDQYGPDGVWTPPDGQVNPPMARKPLQGIYQKMADWDLTSAWTGMSGNLHSTAIYFLLCNIGGCQMPVLWQKNGASVVFASYDSVSFDGGGQFNIRLNQEIADGEMFGDALITALRETSSIYSENSQGVDDTLQYIIYGDPSLSLQSTEPGGGTEGWVLPTGHIDTENAWDDEPNAYDYHSGTKAGCQISEFGWTWTPWVEFTLPEEINFTKIRFYAWYNALHCDMIDIDYYNSNGSWYCLCDEEGVYSDTYIYPDREWMELYPNPNGDPSQISKIRVRFHVRRWLTSPVTADLHEIQIYQVME